MSELLAKDHAELDKLFFELGVAFEVGEVRLVHDRLDEFWARLAMHIRAEHLGLFPAVLEAVSERAEERPSLTEAQTTIEELRGDHDFFVRELASAMISVRKLLTSSDDRLLATELAEVETRIHAVAERLARHNKLEEEGIYLWTSVVLNEAKLSELEARVQTELTKVPPRFVAGINPHN
jgi:hemerythrin HHE cation binding domain-containing protein